ncbi:MAG TPA: sigma-70 family RNA polymerase sigma factor [Cyclobacteriaceae bacterium]|jgi:RNA polymerase sigma factor (sigma-70 family)|nr:sigma-70 family RNA polymerase sigma factor [Cyclobacteriaceae bacterium]
MSIDKQVAAIKADDEQFMHQFYVYNFGMVKQFVLQNNGTADDAKDIYQEAYLAVWRNIKMDRFDPKYDGALEAYIFQVARHKWLDYLRSSRYRNTASWEPEHEVATNFEEVDDTTGERIKSMKACFRKLGENCRRLLTRFYYGKEPMKAIADDMGWTEASAKNNKYRCMEKLREMMK